MAIWWTRTSSGNWEPDAGWFRGRSPLPAGVGRPFYISRGSEAMDVTLTVTNGSVVWGAVAWVPVLSFEGGDGMSRFHVIISQGCYVLLESTAGFGWRARVRWFQEVVSAVAALSPPLE